MDAKSPDSHQRLSGTDAAFLYLERKEIPLHIACVCTFEEVIPYEEFVATIDSKLHLLPRYRQLAVSPPFGIGYPNWEYDRHFDIRRHIIRVTVNAPGDEAELEELASRIFSVLMSREKPLWEVYIVEGLRGGRGALIAKVHHSLADGIAGASLLRIMLDPTAEGSHAIRKPHFQPPAPAREPSLSDALASAIHSSLENLVAAEAGLLDIAQSLLSDRTQQGLQGLVTLLPEIATPVQRLPFNRPCGAERKFCWAEFDFADVKAIRNVTGGTVNDVLLTVVTRAVAKYTKLHGESVAGRLVRMVCPVSVRNGETGETLGNRISFLPVTLPLDAEDPVEHLKAVALRTAIMKSVQAAELLGIAASWLGAAPPPAQALFWWGIPLVPMPAPLLNMICTNVPGSPTPLYSVGKRMLASYPHVPTGYELGVGVAVQSYNGRICFGLTADAVVAADVGRLRDFIRTSWGELCKAAGVVRPAPKAKAAKRARVRTTPKPVTVQSPPPQAVASPEPVQEPAPAEPKRPVTKTRRTTPKPVAVQSPPPEAVASLEPEPVQEPAPAEPAPAPAAGIRSAPRQSDAEPKRPVTKTRPTKRARVQSTPKPVAVRSPLPEAVASPEPVYEPASSEPAPANAASIGSAPHRSDAEPKRPVSETRPTKRARVPTTPKPVAVQSPPEAVASPEPEPVQEPAPAEPPLAHANIA